MTRITIELPEDLASQAKAAGLLGSKQVLSIFRESLRAAARSNLFAQLDVIHRGDAAELSQAQEDLVQEAKLEARRRARNDH